MSKNSPKQQRKQLLNWIANEINHKKDKNAI